MKLTLISFSTNVCTMGKLYHGDDLICHTFELPDRNNAVNVSCIRAGTYQLKMVNSPKFGPSYEIKDVDGRSHILIHTGNTVNDTQGCIMPCNSYGVLSVRNGGTNKEMLAGLSSRLAYTKLMTLLGGDNHTLTIERH